MDQLDNYLHFLQDQLARINGQEARIQLLQEIRAVQRQRLDLIRAERQRLDEENQRMEFIVAVLERRRRREQ
jgi:hypothetical protein